MGSALKRKCIYLKKNNVFVNPLFLLAKEVGIMDTFYIKCLILEVKSRKMYTHELSLIMINL